MEDKKAAACRGAGKDAGADGTQASEGGHEQQFHWDGSGD